MVQVDRLWEFVQRLTPLTRSCLLNELERLELCGRDLPGTADIQAKLRAEFRKEASPPNRAATPQRYFFAPLDVLVVDNAPEHANSGRFPRASLAPIWEWINRDLLPTMARDYNAQMRELIAADKQREAKQVAAGFQTKVAKSLESTLASADAEAQIRARLATYTAAPSAFDDVIKLMQVLRARDALAKFTGALPQNKLSKFDNAMVDRLTKLLDGLRKTHPDAVPFAIATIATRLKTPWHLIRLATKAAPSKNADDVAATPYATAVSMVLDRLEDSRMALRIALKNNRVMNARDLLSEIYDTEYALQVRIDQIDQSEWGARLRASMNAVAVLVEEEIRRFPDEVGHVLGSRRLRSYNSITGKLTYYAWKGRDAVTNSAAQLRKLME